MTNAEAQEELFAVIEQNPDKPDVYWPLFVEFVAKWMQDFYGPGAPPMAMPAQWREEMS